jgi:DEAD/DEAH box helicase domain-containing protein
VTLSFGASSVTEQVHAYQRKRLPDHEVIDLQTRRPAVLLVHHAGAVVRAGRGAAARVPDRAPLGALHAAEHTQIAVLRCWPCATAGTSAGCRRTSTRRPGSPTIFIYDGHPGGVGITLQGFRNFDLLVEDAHRLISECPCESGCPSCVQSPKCGNLNEPLSKAGAAEVMARMLQA